jgi:hypothetical protein
VAVSFIRIPERDIDNAAARSRARQLILESRRGRSEKLEFNQVFQVDRTHDPVSNVSAIGLKIIKIFNFFEFDGARDSVSPS